MGVLLVAGAAAIVLDVGRLLFHTFYGDPTIYLPFARNVAHGDFFSYNPHEFSSGSTSPLWPILLSPAYLVGAGAAGAKAIAAALTVIALLVTAVVAWRVTRSAAGAGIGSFFLVGAMTLSGVLMYESPLVVGLVALSVVAGERAARDPPSFGPLGIVWAALPLARPDALVLVAIELVALWRAGRVRLAPLLATLALASLPSALYFGYSKATLGFFSVSGSGRAAALREVADTLGPLRYSHAAVVYFRSIWLTLALVALAALLFLRDRERRWLGTYVLGAAVVYPMLLVFVSPVTNDVERYFLPVGPLVVVALAGVVAESLRRSALVALVALVAVAVVVVGPATALPDDAAEIGTFGYSFDRITERGIAGRIDRVAPRGSSVLAYEVQDRYFLRDDLRVISLDGLTDAAVAPYRGTNLVGFLRQVRPDYWIANKAVEYRPFLAHTVLHEAYERLIADASLRQVTIDGIEFRVVARRTTPFPVHSSGWWTLLVRLRYQGAP